MTTTLWMLIAIIIILIILSGFFSGSETALTAASRARMHSLKKSGDTRATLVTQLINHRDRLISALLFANNLVNILASVLATSLFIKLFGEAGIIYATIVMTLVVVIFAEVLPKFWAISDPEKFSLAVASPLRIVVAVISPLSNFITMLVRAILRLFGVKFGEGNHLLSAHEELRGTVEVLHQDGSVIKDDRDRLGGLLDLNDMEVSDVMIHRTKMISINADDPPAKIVKQILNSPYTRLPVWRDESENIIGVVHSKDFLRAIAGGSKSINSLNIVSIASQPWFVPENTPLQHQLNAFLRRKAHFALVVDEYGEVEGLVTLEDILEEIVGQIADEHDVDMQGVETQPDGSVIVDGSMPVRDLNRALDWELPDEEATTVAGLVIHEVQMIPDEKQAFTFYGKRFAVVGREKNRITRLNIRDLGS
ncbi:MAG: HlyC/CorC family transporter [Rhizobiaceae bacterium]|nr:HlyC/CorC family transporter [Rhizobiaceae bacterium]